MSSINSNYLILPQNYYQISQIPCTPTFRGGVISNLLPAQATQPLSYPPDTVEISAANKIKKPKEKMSTGAKVGITLASIGALALGTKYGISKYAKYYAKKQLVKSNLVEHLEFKNATKIEDALNYTKNVLKIQNIEGQCSLEALNHVNKALTDISNLHKGKAYLPRKLIFSNEQEKTIIAAIGVMPFHKTFGTLTINKNCYFFDEKALNSTLKEALLKKDGSPKFKDNKIFKNKDCYYRLDKSFQELVNKYYKDSNGLNYNEKMALAESLQRLGDNIATKTVKKTIGKSEEVYYTMIGHLESPFSSIYHELGHLQDLGNKMPKQGLGFLRNTFTTSSIEQVPLLKKFASKEAKEFWKNETTQKTAGEVSWYAKEGVGEFIAETYSGLCAGKKYSEDVMKLYEKYNGPKLGG